jgi:acetyltransferase EpsM
MGEGVFLSLGCIVNAGTTIGDHSVLWSGVIIEHDNRIGENVYLCTGAKTSGYARIGSDSFIGMGAVITQSRIGKSVTVGASSLVLGDVKERTVVWGQPAKRIRVKKSDGYL